MRLSIKRGIALEIQELSPSCACFGYAYINGKLLSPGLSDKNYNTKLTTHLKQIQSEEELHQVVASMEGFFSGWLILGNRVYCFSDYLGLCPIFIYATREKIVFCEDPIELYEDTNTPLSLNHSQLNYFAIHGRFQMPRTAFNEVIQIWGGQIYSFDMINGWKRQTYLDLSDFSPQPSILNRSSLAIKANTILKKYVARYLAEEQNYVVPLSGGLDSRQLAWIAHSFKEIKGHAITYGEKNSPDRLFARQVATILNLNQQEYDLEPSSWLKNASQAIKRTRGLVSAERLLPPAHLVNSYRPIGPILSGVGGNKSVGGCNISLKSVIPLGTDQSIHLNENFLIFEFPKIYAKIIEFRPEFYSLITELNKIHYPSFRDLGYGQYRLPLLERELVTLLLQTNPLLRKNRQLQVSMALNTFSDDLLSIAMSSDSERLYARDNHRKRIPASIRYRVKKLFGKMPSEALYQKEVLWNKHGEEMRNIISQSGLLETLNAKNVNINRSFEEDCALYTLAVAYSKWLS